MKRLLIFSFFACSALLLACTERKVLVEDNPSVDNSIDPDSSIASIIEPYKAKLDSSMLEVVGYLKNGPLKPA